MPRRSISTCSTIRRQVPSVFSTRWTTACNGSSTHRPFSSRSKRIFPYHHARDACSDLAVLGMALPAVFAEVGNLLLQAFTDDGVPTWEISKKTGERGEWKVIAKGTADSFEAAKAAALFEAGA